MVSERRTILLLGSSGMVFTDTGPSGALSALLRAELTQREPAFDWTCLAYEIPPARNMAERVRAAVEEHQPYAVLLAVSASYFTYEYVAARVRRRWPRLFEATRAVGDRFRDAAGGGFAGSDSARGWLFRAPRWAARKVIGAEPYMKVEHALANTLEALIYLTQRDGLVVVFRRPDLSRELPPDVAAAYRQRLDHFNAGISAASDAAGVPHYDIHEAMALLGKVAERVPDGLHGTLEARTGEAQHVAGLILKASAGAGNAGATLRA